MTDLTTRLTAVTARFGLIPALLCLMLGAIPAAAQDSAEEPAADPTSDAFADMTITDMRANARVFSGWMIASSPALSALDDARYDVWVISCTKA